ncbi:GntR family transcriptional regulator [Labrys monachus]|uniref:DNA-binding GntR family transcriptional regulator n=1 Tax=Labrys monachus TaxID=217067 RepID=A0ABU0FM50_9HYPH|nr:GntR family transcriptional regulator [Labrys monachus]MDQ0395675.1 DNA-binding GntR family transcriptional regulator [Labrys monachus]
MTLAEFPSTISRRYLHDEVVARLRDLILSGELEPRSRVNEAALCKRFDISRTPLREAIKLLAAEGLLELLPNRGARVTALSTREVEDVLEVVAALEGAAGELACSHITDTEIAALERMQETMVEAWRAQDAPRYFAFNRQIHEAIMLASRNTALQGVYAMMAGRIQRARYSANKTPEQWVHAIQDHGEMLKFLRARDGLALGALMRRHIRSKLPVITAAFGKAAQERNQGIMVSG